MPARTLHLAEAPSAWIDEQVATGSSPDAAAYIAALVERDRIEAEKLVVLRAAIQEGLDSGISDRTVEQVFSEGREKHAGRSRPAGRVRR